MAEKSFSKLGGVYDKAEILKHDRENHELLQSMYLKTTCADCGAKSANWASCNLGIFLCVDCAQLHRGLGTHISKVKSCMGTYNWHPDEMERMTSIGNARSNAHYLALHPQGTQPSGERSLQYLQDKYQHLRWCKQ
ncbi:hypothetical protein HDV03_005272 [Kappamyces sp. JEL0829]|nr:hypothetical protein HDV03_005272 [Kappamyces sp. JEL0829]